MGDPVISFRDDLSRMIYANLSSGIDAILPLPEFDQPGFASIIKIDRQCINTMPAPTAALS